MTLRNRTMTYQRFELHSLICLFYVFISFTVTNGQIPIEFSVEGKKVIQTGVATFTFWGEDKQVKCSALLPIQNTITLYRNSEEVSDDNDLVEGIYTCRITALAESSHGSKLRYSLESELHLNESQEHTFCLTDIGEVGFVGEKVTLTCGEAQNRWKIKTWDVFLSDQVIETKSCGKNNKVVCSWSFSEIADFLRVEIEPTSFRSDSNVLNFTCNSEPPRLMYWKIFGANGDILDIDRYNTSLMVDVNITIKQSIGETTLVISEAVPNGNGIDVVVCYTYGTRTKAVIARLIPPNTINDPETDSTKVTTMLSVGDPHFVPTENVNMANASSCESQRREVTEGTIQSSNDCLAFITSTMVLIFAAIVLLLFYFILFVKFKKNESNKAEVCTNAVPQETILHDNPVYICYDQHQTKANINEEDKDYSYVDS